MSGRGCVRASRYAGKSRASGGGSSRGESMSPPRVGRGSKRTIRDGYRNTYAWPAWRLVGAMPPGEGRPAGRRSARAVTSSRDQASNGRSDGCLEPESCVIGPTPGRHVSRPACHRNANRWRGLHAPQARLAAPRGGPGWLVDRNVVDPDAAFIRGRHRPPRHWHVPSHEPWLNQAARGMAVAPRRSIRTGALPPHPRLFHRPAHRYDQRKGVRRYHRPSSAWRTCRRGEPPSMRAEGHAEHWPWYDARWLSCGPRAGFRGRVISPTPSAQAWRARPRAHRDRASSRGTQGS